MSALFDALLDLHGGVEASKELAAIEPFIVREAKSGTPVWPSYLPFVGPSYQPGGVLIVATAQNLAGQVGKPSWARATGLPARPLWRLYHGPEDGLRRPLAPAEVDFRRVAIAPWEEGILPALVGLIFERQGQLIDDLTEVTRRAAVMNFFKHSLRSAKGNDLNPLGAGLPAEVARRYRQVTARRYVAPELAILRPGVIVSFKVFAAELAALAPRARVIPINDPAWIKRGMSGAAKKPGGSWQKKVAAAAVPKRVEKLVAAYIEQMAPIYRGKAEAARVYLLRYWSDLA